MFSDVISIYFASKFFVWPAYTEEFKKRDSDIKKEHWATSSVDLSFVSSCHEFSVKKGVRKFHRKTPVLDSSYRPQALKPATLLKRDSNTGVFL